MSEWVSSGILALYYLTLGVLALYGLHRLALLSVLARRSVPVLARPSGGLPLVTVQLPIYNERYVGPRLVDAVARLDYPPERLEIQVLDDSDDDTSALLAEAVERARTRGLRIAHIRRKERHGYKAGALENGLTCARGDLVAIFDADFLPDEGFLRQTVGAFDDPRVGMVQARWEHLNADYSLLTQAQAILLDGHFAIEHAARYRSGRFFNFNGTAGIWRRSAIESAGGWQHDTLTEDLDLSYRVQLEGHRFVFLEDVPVPAELPVSIHAFKSQQHRWARGSVQCARKLLGRLLSSDLPTRTKVEAFVHLTANACYPLLVVLGLLMFPAMLLRRGNDWWTLMAVDLPLFLLATLAVVGFYFESQRRLGRLDARLLYRIPAALALGVGLSLHNTGAVLGGLARMGGIFRRTPKYSISHRGDAWHQKRYRSQTAASTLGELVLTLYFLWCVVMAVQLGMWLSLPFLLLFLKGHAFISWLGLWEAWRAARWSSWPKRVAATG